MDDITKKPARQGLIPAVITFLGIILLIVIIALINAPTMGGPRVMASISTYLEEVKATGIPFIIAAVAIAVIIGFFLRSQII